MSDFAFDPDEARVFMQVLTESSENARESVATLAASKNELHTTFAGNEKYFKYELNLFLYFFVFCKYINTFTYINVFILVYSLKNIEKISKALSDQNRLRILEYIGKKKET